MGTKRLRLAELRVSGTGVPESSVRFAPGLNLIVGASDTGKTFIFQAIDYMLGASRGLRRIPESTGYDRVYLDVDPFDGPAFTLRRAYDGGQFELTEYPSGRSASPSAPKTLKAAHNPDPNDALSPYLLRAIGLSGREVRTNSTGEKRTLSFRDVSHLTLIDEERMIQQASPVVTGQAVTKTAERNVFALFLTGQDDSQVIPQESRAERNARLAVEERLISELLTEKQRELAAVSTAPDELPDQIKKLDEAIREASRGVYSTQEQIREHAASRTTLFEDLTKVRSRLLFLGEQLKRFRLLSEFYDSDRARLVSVIEASRVLHDLPEGSCPLCNQPLIKDGEGAAHANFERSCTQEIAKIDALHRDLKVAIQDFTTESTTASERAARIEERLREADDHMQHVLSPGLVTAKDEMQDLIRSRTTAAQGESIRANVRGLEERLEKIKTARAEKVPKTTFENRASTATATEFCKVVEGILRAWKYPGLTSVSFDTDAADLVIDGQNRSTKGKGHRALAYAAFTIGLMRYCRMKNFPHPGFVILDTPINPFRGPDTGTGDDRLSDETKDAFFEYLAEDESGDQIIIMENEKPPDHVAARVTCYQFTKNTGLGRYGFLPWKPPGDDGNVPAPAPPPEAPDPPVDQPIIREVPEEAKSPKEPESKQKSSPPIKRRKRVKADAVIRRLFSNIDGE